MFFFDLDHCKLLQLVSLQMTSSLIPSCLPATLQSLLSHVASSCIPTHPLSLSFLPFCVFVPKLQSNSFLRTVLLEFNPPSLSFQPLFHCENLGSDLDPFLESGPAQPPSPPCCSADTPTQGILFYSSTIQPHPLIPLFITHTSTVSEP